MKTAAPHYNKGETEQGRDGHQRLVTTAFSSVRFRTAAAPASIEGSDGVSGERQQPANLATVSLTCFARRPNRVTKRSLPRPLAVSACRQSAAVVQGLSTRASIRRFPVLTLGLVPLRPAGLASRAGDRRSRPQSCRGTDTSLGPRGAAAPRTCRSAWRACRAHRSSTTILCRCMTSPQPKFRVTTSTELIAAAMASSQSSGRLRRRCPSKTRRMSLNPSRASSSNSRSAATSVRFERRAMPAAVAH
jgi:hypothetical protein